MHSIEKTGLFDIWPLFIMLLAFGCKTDIDLFTEGDLIPVVYCLLNPDDSVQYIRLSRSFRIEGVDQLSNVSVDQLKFEEDPEIYISEQLCDNQDRFYRCDPLEYQNRDSGLFPIQGFNLYKSKIRLKPESQYELSIYFDDVRKVVFGKIITPNLDFTLIDPLPVPKREANLFEGQDYYVRFSPLSQISVYQSTIYLVFNEIKEGIIYPKVWSYQPEAIYYNNEKKHFLEQRIGATRFYLELSRTLKSDSSVMRIPVCFNFHISAGGEDLALKLQSISNQNPFSEYEYTNLYNGAGVFSLLFHRKIENIPLSRFTIDSLALSQYTKDLGFLTYDEIHQQ